MSGDDEAERGRRVGDDGIIILKQQVGDLLLMVREVIQLLRGDNTTGNPGVLIRLDRLEQLEQNRQMHRTTIYTVLIGLVCERVWHYIAGGH